MLFFSVGINIYFTSLKYCIVDTLKKYNVKLAVLLNDKKNCVIFFYN